MVREELRCASCVCSPVMGPSQAALTRVGGGERVVWSSSRNTQLRLGSLGQVNVGELHQRIVAPTTTFLVLCIVVPKLLLRAPSWTLVEDAEVARSLALLSRLAHAIAATVAMSIWGVVWLVRWLDTVAQSIREEHYLVRRRLRNVDEVPASADAGAT